LGRDPYYGLNRILHGTRWDGQKNEVITFNRDAKINNAGSTFNGELQAGLLIGFAKQKKKVAVSLHNFPCILISRSLPSIKEMCTTAFRQTYSQLHHTVQNK